MSNSFSIGVDAEIVYQFEKNRKFSQIQNIFVYIY